MRSLRSHLETPVTLKVQVYIYIYYMNLCHWNVFESHQSIPQKPFLLLPTRDETARALRREDTPVDLVDLAKRPRAPPSWACPMCWPVHRRCYLWRPLAKCKLGNARSLRLMRFVEDQDGEGNEHLDSCQDPGRSDDHKTTIR